MFDNGPLEAARRDALAGRFFEATLGAMDILAVQLGLELGLYRTLHGDGAATPPELAQRAGIDARYAREWLEHQAVAGILDVDDVSAGPDDRRYTLPSGHAEALLDPDSPSTVAPLALFVTAGARLLPDLVAAYRSGTGVAWDADPAVAVAQEAANRPLFRHVLTQEWLAALPDIHERLLAEPRARVADVACGTGLSTIALARGYPGIEVHGLDVDRESIERARAHAAEAGLSEDRLQFHLVDAQRHDLDGTFDLALIVEAVHDLARPVEVLASVRRLLAPGAPLIVVDERVADTFTAPGDAMERLFYGYSVLFCLPNSLADPPSVGTGTVMRTSTLERYAREAGFAGLTVLPIEHDVFRLYRLDP